MSDDAATIEVHCKNCDWQGTLDVTELEKVEKTMPCERCGMKRLTVTRAPPSQRRYVHDTPRCWNGARQPGSGRRVLKKTKTDNYAREELGP
jgi:hypothetical protein